MIRQERLECCVFAGFPTYLVLFVDGSRVLPGGAKVVAQFRDPLASAKNVTLAWVPVWKPLRLLGFQGEGLRSVVFSVFLCIHVRHVPYKTVSVVCEFPRASVIGLTLSLNRHRSALADPEPG